jgi:hypothetical protein
MAASLRGVGIRLRFRLARIPPFSTSPDSLDRNGPGAAAAANYRDRRCIIVRGFGHGEKYTALTLLRVRY